MDLSSNVPPDDDATLLARYYAGLCRDEELARAERLIQRPADYRFVRGLQSALRAMAPTPTDAARRGAIDALRARIAPAVPQRTERGWANRSWPMFRKKVNSGSAPESKRPVGPSRCVETARTRRAVWRNAAILGGAGAALTLAFFGGGAGRTGTILRDTWSRWIVARGAAPTVVRSYVTGPGEQAVLTLADRTRITLAPMTRLRVLELSDRARHVTLEGEAHFEVVQSGGAPFIVRSGTVDTRVLGTTFLVRHYRGDRYVRIAVTQGKVSAAASSPQHPTVTLTAGQVGEITDSSATTTASDDMAPYVGWMDGQLVFRQTSTTEVLATLGRWYGYEFRVADSAITHQHLTVGLSTRSSAEALSTLKLLLDVDLRFQGHVVTLVPRHTRHIPGRLLRAPSRILSPFNREAGR